MGVLGVFLAEFLLRAYIARFQAAFWRRNWWQVIFLLIPFLRFVRALQAFRLVRLARLSRLARAGGIVSAGGADPGRPGGCCRAGSGGWRQ